MRIHRSLAACGLAMTIAASTLATSAGAAEYRAGDYSALLAALPSAQHGLADVIATVTEKGEAVTESKFEMKDGELMVGVYSSEKGLGADAEHNVLKEYNGVATQAAWEPKVEVFEDFEHIARSAQYHTLMSLTDIKIDDVIERAQRDQAGTVFEVKPQIEEGVAIFSVLVAHDGTVSRLVYDLQTGAPKG